jgi:hypothetical protein
LCACGIFNAASRQRCLRNSPCIGAHLATQEYRVPMKSMLAPVIAILCAGCDAGPAPIVAGPTCTEPFAFPLSVQAFDSVKGTPISSGLQGEIRNATFVSPTVMAPAGGSLLIFTTAFPTGTYDLDLRATGYLNWHTTGVVLAQDKCGIFVTQSLIARLMVADPAIASVRVTNDGPVVVPGQTITIVARVFPTNFFIGRSRAIIFSITSGDSAISIQAVNDTTVGIHANRTGQSVVKATWSQAANIFTNISVTTSPQ